MLLRQKHKELIAKIVTVAIVAFSVMSANLSGALAAQPTLMKDVMSDLTTSATAITHVVTMTLPGGGITPGTTGTLVITWPGFSAMSGTPAITCGTGTATSLFSSGNVLTITSGGTACSGTLSIASFTGTNPAGAGSVVVTVVTGVGTGGISGSFAVTLVTSDQVAVTASIDPSITFNVGAQASGTACAGSFAGNGGTVALGTLTTGAVATSDTSVSNICTRLTTNAGSGAVVTVKSLNAALKSTAYPSDTIASSTATLVAGTSGYGICVGSSGAGSETGKDATTPLGATPTATAPFASTCTTAAHNVGGLTTGAQSIWSVSGAVQNGYFKLYMKAAISGTVPAHTDYADTLTFVATGTF